MNKQTERELKRLCVAGNFTDEELDKADFNNNMMLVRMKQAYELALRNCEIRIRTMQSSNGNDVPNQLMINVGRKVYFQSYNSIIACEDLETGKVTLSQKWDYATTTGKYRNQFLNEDKRATEKKIIAGIYDVVEELELVP